ncbi:uncharacterized protein BXZ73DRAFT_87965 [Epithele typhae]|uniref:uncharacterized protein n=1 Tax=Epithele typhae TaxID=378194 RepID=UPI0020082E1F|nr:uncharacterized protein BXZ73DRAFT_87965 [Epithele typhae]KAH9942359.1 hypothetical protein BXZ73DRAFT_87965 [Epithele typhae]
MAVNPLFPLTIDDTSPLVVYQPFADTFTIPNVATGWNPFYTLTGFATVATGADSEVASALGNGTSLHLTACDGASLQVSWNGTDITLFGTLVLPPSGSNLVASYSVNLDGTDTTNFLSNISHSSTVDDAVTDVLVQFKNLSDGAHVLQLTMHNSDDSATAGNSTTGPIIAFDRAVVISDSGKPGPAPPASSATSPSAATPSSTATAVTSPVPDDDIAFRGRWSFQSGLLPDSDAIFHSSSNVGDRASLTFNGSAVSIIGLTTPASGAYNVTLDKEEPISISGRASFTSNAPTLLFFRTGLDPSVMHAIDVVNAGPAGAGDGAGSLLFLSAVNVTRVESGAIPIGASESPSGLPQGVIAAIAIGVTLFVALILALVVLCLRRRRRREHHKRSMLVSPQMRLARRLSFLLPHRRHESPTPVVAGKAREMFDPGYLPGAVIAPAGVLDICSPSTEYGSYGQEKDGDSADESDFGEGEGADGRRFSAVEKGKARALRQSGASKNSDGSYSIELPDLTIVQNPHGYLPPSAVPSTPSPPGHTLVISSPTSPSGTKPKGPREFPGRCAPRESTRGILLAALPSRSSPGPYGSLQDVDLSDSQMLGVPAPSYLPEAVISPLRVEFASDVEEHQRDRHLSAGAVSLPPSLKQALAEYAPPVEAAAATPPSPTRTTGGRMYSFLDLSSSASTSLRSQRQSSSNSTSKTKSRSSSRSTRSNSHSNSRSMGTTDRTDRSQHVQSPPAQTLTWASLPPDRRISLGLSMTFGGGSSVSRPSISTANLSMHPISPSYAEPSPPLPTSSAAAFRIDSPTSGDRTDADDDEADDDADDFPYTVNQLPSPTDSIPYTVSDIHFRHSTHSSILSGRTESRRESRRLSASHRPPHPPLPSSPGLPPNSPSSARPTHHRGMSQTSGSQQVPPMIVQRILGRAPASNPPTPMGPQFATAASFAAARAAASSPVATVHPATPMPVPRPTPSPHPTVSQGGSTGPAQTQATPGSSTSVFGFQIGRHLRERS